MQDTVSRCLGLVTQFNPIATQPGALIEATDCVIRRENTIENRRGYLAYTTLSSQPLALLTYLKRILAHNGTKLSYDNGSGTFSDYLGSYNAPSGYKMRGVESKSNLYFTTDQGIKVVGDLTGSAARLSGVPRSLDPSYTLSSGSTGFLAPASQSAYRVVIQRTDAQGNVIFGYPSTRLWVANPTYVTTGSITNASTSLTTLASVAGIAVGMTITGTGIPGGTTVSSISGSTVTMSLAAQVPTYTTTGSTTSGSNQITSVASSANVGVGMVVSGSGIPSGTTILAINTATSSGATTIDLTLSANATVTATGVTLTLSPLATNIPVTFGQNANTAITLYLPTEVTTSDVIQVYRTASVSYSSQFGDAAGDEMALVYQVSPTSTDISNKYLTFTDSVTDALRGASLYTSPSQEGISQANDRPPLAKDLSLYKSAYLFYANTSTKQRLYLTLVGTSSLYNGGAYGKTVTIAGTTYTFSAAENASTGNVVVDTPSIAASDIDKTARSLVRVINRYASNTSVYAYYISGPSDLPGQILLEERGVGASAFSVTALDTGTSAMIYPPPPLSGSASLSTSTNSVQKNAIYYSKTQQPEHVPAANYILVGPANTEILRILALRDSLIIIKEEGVYALRGDSPQSFNVVPLDLTVYCKSPDSLRIIANQVMGLFNQGVCAVSDTGVQVISREIEPSLTPLLSYSNLSSLTSACAYESERTYLLSTVSTLSDSTPTQIFCFNIFTKAWTTWSFGFTSAIVEPAADKLFFSKPGSVSVYQERKSFSISDYADPEYAISITSLSGKTVNFTVTGTTPQSGWAIGQGGTNILIDTVINTGTGFQATLVYTPPSSWSVGGALLYPSIQMKVKWDAWTAEQPAVLKHVRQYEILSDNLSGNNQCTGFFATFQTDQDEYQDQIGITTATYRFGTSPWGEFPWGGRADTFAYRTYIPKAKNYCRVMNPGLIHQRAFEKMSISGFSMTFEVISERVSR